MIVSRYDAINKGYKREVLMSSGQRSGCPREGGVRTLDIFIAGLLVSYGCFG